MNEQEGAAQEIREYPTTELPKAEVTVESTPKEDKGARRISSIDDIPEVTKKTFSFTRDGQEYTLEYTPLAYQDVEEIRANMLPPKPPMRRISGLEKMGAKELASRAMMGLPTTEPDTDDPAYRTHLVKYNNDLKIEQVRKALGWGVPKDEFLALIRRKFYPGELQALMDEVDGNAWAINSSLLDTFFQSSAQLTGSDESSKTSEES